MALWGGIRMLQQSGRSRARGSLACRVCAGDECVNLGPEQDTGLGGVHTAAPVPSTVAAALSSWWVLGGGRGGS